MYYEVWYYSSTNNYVLYVYVMKKGLPWRRLLGGTA